MRNSILTVLVLVFGTVSCFAQVDALINKAIPQPVTNPILEQSAISMSSAQNAMNATITTMEVQQKTLNELLKKAGWARDLETVRRLLFMLERVVCTSKDLNVRLSYFDASCLFDFNFEMNLVKIHMAADFLSILITDGVVMTTGERLDAINRSVETFYEAQTSLGNLNSSLDKRLRQMAVEKDIKETNQYLARLQRR